MTFDLGAIGAGLPVAASLGSLTDAVAAGGVVVWAPPGSGKTTLIPPALANLVGGRVVVTQPRRVAARAAARRLATLAHVRLGHEVGFVVRGERRVSASTKVEFCTAGVLLRRLLTSPELPGVDALVLDEVHERALETDLTFAMVAELRQLRPELLVVVMSATLDAARWGELLGAASPAGQPAPLVRVDSALHPLEIRWAPFTGVRVDERGVTRDFLDHVAAEVARELTAPGASGRVLAFLPGARECDEVAQRVRSRGLAADVLHGSLAAAQQDAVLGAAEATSDHAQPRAIVATAIAESSLTVPGVRVVVDSGLAREPRFDRGRGMSGLVTVSEARASAEQRAGRAARLGPGRAVRCFAETDWSRLRPFVAPAITTTDLTAAALDLAAWGAPGGRGLSLPDAPPAAALASATKVLLSLGALEPLAGTASTGESPSLTPDAEVDPAHVRITPLGRRLSQLPVEPRLGRALLACAPSVGPRRCAEIVAMLAGDERAPGGDLVALLRRLRHERPPSWLAETERLKRLVARDEHEAPGRGTGGGRVAERGADQPLSDADAVAAVVAGAYPDRVARLRTPGSTDYVTTKGTGVGLPRVTALAGHEWLAIAEVARVGEHAVVRSAVGLSEDAALRATASLRRERTIVTWASGKVSARRVVSVGALEWASTPVTPTLRAGTAAVRAALAEQGLAAVLGWDETVELLRRRLALLHRVLGEPWPAVDDQALTADAETWLAPELQRLALGEDTRRLDLVAALRRLLPWPAAGRLDELVPERLEVPTGSRVRLEYPADPSERVVLAVKLQECFGMVETPRIVDGRVPVLLHLLSPAGRPLAITDDLSSFWANAYPDVRAENRGRYSKHPWPEDPRTAPPRRGTTRSGR